MLHGEIRTAVAGLKQKPGCNLVTKGNSQLVHSLLPDGLIDDYLSMIHPIVLGSGQRLFEHQGPVARLHLIDRSAAANDLTFATYRPEPPHDVS